MKKYLLFIAIVAGGWRLLPAQLPDLEMGPVFKVSESYRMKNPVIVGNNEMGYLLYPWSLPENVYTYRSNYPSTGFILQYVSPDLEFIESKRVIIGIRKDQEDFIDCWIIDGKFVFLSYKDNRKEKRHELHLREVITNPLSIPEEGTKIWDCSYVHRPEFENIRFGITSSPDGSKILIYNTPLRRLRQPIIRLSVLATDFEDQWEAEITLPVHSNKWELADVGIREDGNVVIGGKTDSGSVQDSIRGNLRYYTVNPLNEKPEEKNFELKEKWSDILLTDLSHEDSIFRIGYWKLGAFKKIKGYVYHSFDPKTGKIVSEKYHPLSTNLFTLSGLPEDTGENNLWEGPLFPNDFTKSPHGVFFGELNENMYQGEDKIAASEGIVLEISPEGELSRTAFIPKPRKKFFYRGGRLSYGFLENTREIFLLISAHPENPGLNSSYSPEKSFNSTSLKKMAVRLVCLGEPGEGYTSKIIYSSVEDGFFTDPSQVYQTVYSEEYSEGIMIFKNGDYYRLGRLTF
ncbi:MAG: hypothetical protein R3D00_25065 [Bacteroidia bacterium]